MSLHSKPANDIQQRKKAYLNYISSYTIVYLIFILHNMADNVSKSQIAYLCSRQLEDAPLP